MQIKPDSKDVKEIIEKVEFLWKRTKEIRDQFPDSPKLIETANTRPIFAKSNKKPTETTWEKADKELKARFQAKHQQWKQDIMPLLDELDFALIPYQNYFRSAGLISLTSLDLGKLNFILHTEAMPEHWRKKVFASEENDLLGFDFYDNEGTEVKITIDTIIHDLKRTLSIIEKKAEKEQSDPNDSGNTIEFDTEQLNNGPTKEYFLRLMEKQKSGIKYDGAAVKQLKTNNRSGLAGSS